MAEPEFGLGVCTHRQFASLPSPATWIQAQNASALLTLELYGSTYMQIFFDSIDKYCNTSRSMGG